MTNANPVNLYVEKLIVIDQSVYADHERFANTTNENLVLNYINIYFSHYVALINQKFVNTFQNDSNMNIYVVLKNVLILTVEYIVKLTIFENFH